MNHLDTMKQALEALEYLQGIVDTERGPKAAAALRLAIEQAEKAEPDPCKEGSCDCCWTEKAEPVAWLHWLHGPVRLFMNKDEAMMELDRLNREYPVDADARQMRPLYTAPPQRQPEPEETALRLAAQWTGNQPCPKCGFAALHCRCAPPQRQPEHEGCACRWDDDDKRVATCERHQGWLDVIAEWADRARAAEDALKKQPPQRQPLTGEEIDEILLYEYHAATAWHTFARAIEAAHGIGGDK